MSRTYAVPEPFISDAEAANFLGGLHVKTLQRWARAGTIPAHRLGKYWRFRASELSDWMLTSRPPVEPSASTEQEAA